MKELTFNGIRAVADMGLKVQSRVRNILPEPFIAVEEIPGMDGDYDFSEVNPDSRTKYKPYVDEITFSIIEPDSDAVIDKAREIADWLACGQAQLIYDDDPSVYRIARIINKLSIEAQLIKLRTFTAQFKCQPLAFAINEIQTTFENITAAAEKTVANPGTYVKPKITVTGSFTTLVLTCGSKTLTYSEAISGSTLVIDFEKMSCIKDINTNKSAKLSGSFFEFVNGNNVLSIGGTGLNCDVTVSFRPCYR